MQTFELLQPETLRDAISLLSTHGGEARIFAGGQDLLYRYKRRLSSNPFYLVDVSRIDDLRGFEVTEDGRLVIAPLTTLGELERAPGVRDAFPMIHSAISEIATPQIRNLATVGGNLFQDVWCWYLLENYDCWLNGGKYCYAVTGDNRYYHSIMGGRHCVAAHPSDLAPALIAADATVTIAGPGGHHSAPAESLWAGFNWVNGKLQNHSLDSGEIVTRIELPRPAPGSRAAFIKYRLRDSWDFALGEVAAALVMAGERCMEARIALGAVATQPLRARHAEAILSGNELTDEVIGRAAEAAVVGARALTGNHYKLSLIQGLCRKVLRSIRQTGEYAASTGSTANKSLTSG